MRNTRSERGPKTRAGADSPFPFSSRCPNWIFSLIWLIHTFYISVLHPRGVGSNFDEMKFIFLLRWNGAVKPLSYPESNEKRNRVFSLTSSLGSGSSYVKKMTTIQQATKNRKSFYSPSIINKIRPKLKEAFKPHENGLFSSVKSSFGSNETIIWSMSWFVPMPFN